jgi:hypothetical protein
MTNWVRKDKNAGVSKQAIYRVKLAPFSHTLCDWQLAVTGSWLRAAVLTHSRSENGQWRSPHADSMAKRRFNLLLLEEGETLLEVGAWGLDAVVASRVHNRTFSLAACA